MIIWITGLLAFGVLGAGIYSGWHRVWAQVRYWTATSRLFPKSPEYRGERVDIAPGEVEVLECLQFVADYTGRPVVFNSKNPQTLQPTILVVEPMEDVTAERVQAILEANRFQVETLKLIDGDEVIFVVDPRLVRWSVVCE